MEQEEKISNAIESLTDLTEKTILRMKYVNRMTRGFYFTENVEYADNYRKDGDQLLKGYLDIKKHASKTTTIMCKAELIKLIKAIARCMQKSLYPKNLTAILLCNKKL